MAVRKYTQPDRSIQTGSTYRDNIDNSLAVVAEIGQQFAPHAADTPDLTVKVDAGRMFVNQAMVTQAQQSVSGFVATGANQRIDRVVIDALTGAASRVAGSESASPVAPAVPTGKLPCAQVGPFTTSTTAITNSMITDERVPSAAARGKQTVWATAGSMLTRTTTGAGTSTTETTTNKIMLKTLDFDPGTDEFAQFQVKAPKGWDEGTITARFVWTYNSGSGNVIWGIQGVAIADDEALDAAPGTAVLVTDTGLGVGDNHISPETAAMTFAGSPTEGDLLIFQVYRDANDAGDTLNADARLIGVEVIFNFNAPSDA